MKHMSFLAKVLIMATTAVVFTTTSLPAVELTDEQMENLVRRSYQYVAMYNVINKAAMQEDNPMKTGWTAWIFAFAGFLLPYMFVYNNSLLLIGTATEIIFSIITGIIGVICLGSGIIGYLLEKTKLHERILVFAAAFLLIFPGYITDGAGILCVILTVVSQIKARSTPTVKPATCF